MFQQEFLLIRNTPFGDLQIRYYGIIIVVAMLVAAYVAARLAKRRGYDADHIWGGLTWAIFPGIIGARLWHVFFPSVSAVERGFDTNYMLTNFFDTTNGAIAIWNGGLGIFGAVLGGLLGVWLYCSPLHNRVAFASFVIFYPFILVIDFVSFLIDWPLRKITGRELPTFKLPKFTTTFPDGGIPMLPWLDIAAVVLPLAQSIGRWGNFVNQELYGSPTTLPWGILIDVSNRVAPYNLIADYPPDTRFHPLFLYESLWNLGAFFVLLYLYNQQRNRFKPGDFFLIYLIQYSVIRFFLEFLRVEVATIGATGINSSQATSVVLFVIALLLFLIRRRSAAQQSYDEATPMPSANQAAAARS
ncbi:MAG: prolipoprotein diacylglyceryl transferase [Anaerolineae bacterium]